MASVFANCGRTCRKIVRPWVMSLAEDKAWYAPIVKPAYDIICSVATCAAINGIGTAFLLLDFKRGWHAWGTTYYIYPVGTVLALVILSSGLIPRLPTSRKDVRVPN